MLASCTKLPSEHVGWQANGKALAGFSHGAAGIAYALLKLHQASSDPRLATWLTKPGGVRAPLAETYGNARGYERLLPLYAMSEWNQEKMQETLKTVFAKATRDKTFRELTLTRPNEAIRQVAGVDIPAGFAVRFVENGGADATFVLPVEVE